VVSDLRAGRAAFEALTEDAALASRRIEPLARAAARRFTSADRRAMGSPWLGAVARVPLIGRPANWLRSAAGVAGELGSEAVSSAARIDPLLGATGGGPDRLGLLAALDTELTRLGRVVDDIRLPRVGGFLPFVSTAERELNADLDRLRRSLDDGAAVARGLRSFLAGPSSYVILASNNAEMRAGGMALQAGLFRAEDGEIQAGGFRPTANLKLKKAVPLPAELSSLYGFLDPGREWRNLGSSPNFPQIAPIYAAMARERGVQRVDGVLQLDIVGLKAFLEVIGPVELDGRRYDAANVERLLMHDLYVEYDVEQGERREDLSRLAAAAFKSLAAGDWPLDTLAKAFRRAAAGRHLLAWSERPVDQGAWEGLGVDGGLHRDGFMVTVQNHTGNKLDWFIRPTVDVELERPEGKWRRISARIRIDNPTPLGESPFVAGNGSLVPAGDHRALVAVYLPGWATNVEVPGRTPLLIGTDGPMRVVAVRLDVARGGSVTVDVVFSVPPEIDSIVLLPSGRARPVRVRLNGRPTNDAAARTLRL